MLQYYTAVLLISSCKSSTWVIWINKASLCSDPGLWSQCNRLVFNPTLFFLRNWYSSTWQVVIIALQAEYGPVKYSNLNQHFYGAPDITACVSSSHMLSWPTGLPSLWWISASTRRLSDWLAELVWTGSLSRGQQSLENRDENVWLKCGNTEIWNVTGQILATVQM